MVTESSSPPLVVCGSRYGAEQPEAISAKEVGLDARASLQVMGRSHLSLFQYKSETIDMRYPSYIEKGTLLSS